MNMPEDHICYLIDEDGITQYLKKRTVNDLGAIVETKYDLTPDKSQAKRYTERQAANIRHSQSEFHYMRV